MNQLTVRDQIHVQGLRAHDTIVLRFWILLTVFGTRDGLFVLDPTDIVQSR